MSATCERMSARSAASSHGVSLSSARLYPTPKRASREEEEERALRLSVRLHAAKHDGFFSRYRVALGLSVSRSLDSCDSRVRFSRSLDFSTSRFSRSLDFSTSRFSRSLRSSDLSTSQSRNLPSSRFSRLDLSASRSPYLETGPRPLSPETHLEEERRAAAAQPPGAHDRDPVAEQVGLGGRKMAHAFRHRTSLCVSVSL